jgi:molybdenum cofactor cytidylyltransferase
MKSKDLPRFDALVLAAGAGRRFGGKKLLARWKDGDVLGAAIAVARQAPIRTLILVTGSDPAIGEGRPGVSLVAEAQGWESGMAASLRMGLESVPPDCEGVFIFLGDMPRIPVAVLQPLAEAVAAGAQAAAPAFGGRRGHPVLVSRHLFKPLLALEGDQGARAVLDRLGDRLALVPAPDDGVLFDVDRPEDLARAGGPA